MPADRSETVGGLTVVGGLLTGFLSLAVAALALFVSNWVGAGISLVAAALSFGLLANAVWRQ
jgi:hypothetical protein